MGLIQQKVKENCIASVYDGSPAAMTSEVLNGLVIVGERHIHHNSS